MRNSKPLALCAVLATMPGYAARRGYIAELFWPGVPRSRARCSLRQAIFYLSERLGKPLILADESNLELNTSELTVDILELEDALAGGEFERAAELYSGPFLAGFERKVSTELESWIEAQNERLRPAIDVAFGGLIQEALDADDPNAAVRWARRYSDLNPLDDTAQTALVRALTAAGDKTGVLQAYQSYRALLRRELDAEPSEELKAMIADLNNHRPEPRVAERRRRRVLVSAVRLKPRSVLAGAAALAVLMTLGAWRLAVRADARLNPLPTARGQVAVVLLNGVSANHSLHLTDATCEVRRSNGPAAARGEAHVTVRLNTPDDGWMEFYFRDGTDTTEGEAVDAIGKLTALRFSGELRDTRPQIDLSLWLDYVNDDLADYDPALSVADAVTVPQLIPCK